MRALESRFGIDLGRIRSGKTLTALSQKHGLDIKQIERVQAALKQLDKGQSQLRARARQMQRSQAKGIERDGPQQ